MNLASSRLGQVIGRRGHVRGAYRLLYRSYAKASELPGTEVLTISNSGDHFAVDFRSYLPWIVGPLATTKESWATYGRSWCGPVECA